MAYKTFEDLTQQELESISQCGSVGFSYLEVATIFGLDPVWVRQQFTQRTGELYRLYQAGRLQAELILRRSILDSANNGSSPSQLYMMKLYEQVDATHHELDF